MNNVTFLILIDALRHDYINPIDAPYLYSLTEKGVHGSVRETFAYQLRPAFLAGLYPDSCNIAHLYWYEPETSPFKFTKYIPEIILKIPKLRGCYKRFINQYARMSESRRGNSASSYYASAAGIPYDLLHYFGFSEKKLPWEPCAFGNSNVTLFDLLRQNKLEWLWIGYPTDDQKTESIVNKFLKEVKKDYSFIFLHFAELDWVGHSYGPHTPEQKRTLREIDSAIERIFLEVEKSFDEVKGLVFGDHGMVEIKKCIDIEKRLNEVELKAGKDYVYFLDSTQARFWFNHGSARKKIEDLLKSINNGRILHVEDLKDLHFRFSHNRFGELIYIVEDNTQIFPNFFQVVSPAKGMHGYLPHVQGNWAKFILFGSDKKTLLKEPIEMVDLFPIILDLMGLSVPDSCEGTNPLK